MQHILYAVTFLFVTMKQRNGNCFSKPDILQEKQDMKWLDYEKQFLCDRWLDAIASKNQVVIF